MESSVVAVASAFVNALSAISDILTSRADRDLPRALYVDREGTFLRGSFRQVNNPDSRSLRNVADSCYPDERPGWMQNQAYACLWRNLADGSLKVTFIDDLQNNTVVNPRLRQPKLKEFQKIMRSQQRAKSERVRTMCQGSRDGSVESCITFDEKTEQGDDIQRPRVVFFPPNSPAVNFGDNECIQGVRTLRVVNPVVEGTFGNRIHPRLEPWGHHLSLDVLLDRLQTWGSINDKRKTRYFNDNAISTVATLGLGFRLVRGGAVDDFFNGKTSEIALPMGGEMEKCSHNSNARSDRAIAGLEIFGFVVAGAVVIWCGSKAWAGGRSLGEDNELELCSVDIDMKKHRPQLELD